MGNIQLSKSLASERGLVVEWPSSVHMKITADANANANRGAQTAKPLLDSGIDANIAAFSILSSVLEKMEKALTSSLLRHHALETIVTPNQISLTSHLDAQLSFTRAIGNGFEPKYCHDEIVAMALCSQVVMSIRGHQTLSADEALQIVETYRHSVLCDADINFIRIDCLRHLHVLSSALEMRLGEAYEVSRTVSTLEKVSSPVSALYHFINARHRK
jgi:hypothetical protein